MISGKAGLLFRFVKVALFLSVSASVGSVDAVHAQSLVTPTPSSSDKSWNGPFVDAALNKKIQSAPKDAQLPALQAILAATGSVKVIVGLNLPFQPMGNIPPSAQTAQVAAIASAQNDLVNALSGQNAKDVKTFKHIPYMAMTVDSAALKALMANPKVSVIEEDRPVPPTLLESVPLIKADAAWGMGYDGTGWTVAVLDTGVDSSHYMLDAGKVVAEACYSTTNSTYGSTTVCPNGLASQTGAGAGVDCNSVVGAGACDHGTHVAGIAAGLDTARNGVAKSSNVIAVQVFSKFTPAACGSSSPCVMSYSSDQISGLDYVYSLRNTYQIASVNMSLGGGQYFSNCDSTETATKAAIDNLRSVGIATVIASGNSGYKDSMGAPGCISTAVSVGSTCDSAGGSYCAGVDSVATYSNSASFLSILAPGSFITSSTPGGLLGVNWSGTSMATPHVAGAWALMKQKDPAGSVATILSLLQSTGVMIADSNSVTKPRIAMDAALGAQTYTVTATAGAGGTVSPASQIVASGSTAPFTVTPDAGYTADVAVGGTCAAGSWSGTTYTTGVVTAACSVSFTFSVGPGLGDAVDNPTLSWSSSGNAQWFVENTIYNSGGSAAQSGDITNSQSSAIQTTVTGPGSLSFYWKVSSEIDYDWLEFAIDGTVQTRMSGTSSWLKKSYSISAGSHTLLWTYTKDTTSSSGSDAGWLDTVVFTPQSGVTLTATAGTGGSVTPASQRVASGSTASFTAVANTGYTPNTTVGGTCAAGSWSGTTYTTGAVTASCSVSFTFTPQVGSLTVTISPAGAITAGAMWRVDGGAWQVSGATVSNVAVGSPTVSFNTVAGYTTPANQNVAVTTIGTATATGTYTAITESTGSLTVTILPPDAVAAGAQWRVDGGPWQADGATVTELANGSHTVWFSPTAGYKSPANKNVAITMGQTATSSGTYTAAAGSGAVKVNILPAGAVTAGAQWSVDGGATWNASGDTLNGLTVGSYTVSFDALSDYTSPEDKVVNVTNGGTAISTGTYKQHGSLKVTILPAGAANGGAQWSVDGGATWNASGDIVPGLTAGKQTVMFNTAATDYSPPANRIVTITPGRTATATGTYTRGYNVLAKVSTGGTATPAKRVVLTGGSTATITVTARTGYTTSATVGGTCVAGSWSGTDYTTGPVTEACTALFTFTKAPTVTTGSALRITQTDAILNGRVNPENDSTTVTFEYVDDATFLASAYAAPSSVSAAVLTGGIAQNVAAPVTGLTCGTKYHFRVVGVNAVNTTPGLDRTFTTSACPDRAADSATDTATSPTSDFDGDGKSDILFRDAVTGQTQAWIMDGVTVTSNLVTSLNAGAYSSTIGWQAQGIGDFDGDKKYDLLWRDSASGQVAVWTMNGADVVTTLLASMSPGAYTATTGWQIQGIGDFDGDVKSDILWRDAGTGQTAIWFMSGSTVMSSSNTNVSAGAYTATAGWQVHGVGDFNGDGKSDILWRQIGTGRTAIWFMDGAFKSGGGYTNVHAGAYTATTGWQIHGVGDFNADGKSDILWRNADSGVTVVWLMNGAVRASGAYTSVQPGPYTTTTGWHVQGVGDFNGDWKSDVLLRYAGTGQTFIWLMNGATVTGDWTSIHAGVFDSATGLQILSEETIR